ncbi:hypothetical protein GQ457_07G017860 [Hibiscus cannabinus]
MVKLKTECGYQFISNLEGMFTDMKTSQDTMQGFYASHPELADGPILVVQVLTTGYWPIQTSITYQLPPALEKFRSYYLGSHTCRRLFWQTNMGTTDIKATFGKGPKHELNEIEQATGIPASDLRRCLQSMVFQKQVLQRIGTVAAQNESSLKKTGDWQRVEESRKPHIEAAIVSPSEIKKRIVSYRAGRDDDDRKLYQHLI